MDNDNFMAQMDPIALPKHDIELIYDEYQDRLVDEVTGADMEQLVEKYQSVKEKERRRKQLRRDIRDKVVGILHGMSSRQRASLKKYVTLRDDDIFIYDDTSIARMPKIYTAFEKRVFERSDVIDGGDALPRIRDAILSCNFGTSNYRKDKKINVKRKTSNVIDGYDKAVYSDGQVKIRNTDSWSSKETVPLPTMAEDGVSAFLREMPMSSAVRMTAMSPIIGEVLDTAEKRADRMIERREQALDTVQEAGAKHLVLRGL